MTEPTATPYEPGGDMIAGVTRAHVEGADEIAATPTDIEVEMPRCTACGATGEALLSSCPNTQTGDHVRSSDLPRTWHPDQGGEPAEPLGPSNRHLWPHAKVVLLMVSVGKEDADRGYEDFVSDLKQTLIGGGGVKSVTETGGYYIINGRVCMPADYDPATRGFRPGAEPPQWAGGPSKAQAQAQRTRGTSVPAEASPEDAVRALAEGINREVRRGD